MLLYIIVRESWPLLYKSKRAAAPRLPPVFCCMIRTLLYSSIAIQNPPPSVVFNLVYWRLYPAHRLQALLPPLPVFVCFSCGGLGVGEKPTRGELARSTHRVPSPFISSQRFPFETFRVSQHSMGLAAAYGPFLPAVYHPFVLREAG